MSRPMDGRVELASPETVPAKPRLRGVSHQYAFFASIVATVALIVGARSASAKTAALVFGASLVLLFGTSALYHRIDWSPAARQMMRRLDHAAIFTLIAGGYTPLFMLVPNADGGHGALLAIWLGTAVGVAKSVAWPKAPKWVTAGVCVLLGWTVAGQVMARVGAVGVVAISLIVVSGVVYSAGAIVYALKRPDPFPRTFGYHEVFHALVILASVALFGHVACVIRAVG